MPALTLARATEILRDHQANASRTWLDIAISLRICDVDTSSGKPVWLTETDEEIAHVGGRYDLRRKKYIGDAREHVILRVPRGSDQEQPARWLAMWFARRETGITGPHWDVPEEIAGRPSCVRWGRKLAERKAVEFRRVWTLMLVGGRRGGKSHLAVVALAMMLVAAPTTICWAISPTQTETDELETALRTMLARGWFTVRMGGAGKDLQFKLRNGSRLLFLSGYKPRSLKRGRCDMALLNEAQNMHRATWRQLRGAIADKAGLVLLSCNPPDEAIGRWIDELAEMIVAGRVKAEKFHFVGKGNPLVTEEALADMRAEVDDVTAKREIDGVLGIPIGDTVFHAWSPESIREVPGHYVDVTAEITKKYLGRAAGYVVGMDFQRQPHEAAAVLKFFRDPDDPTGEILTWVVDGVLVADANEDELLDALEAIPRWQPGDGDPDKRDPARPKYRGWIEPDDDKLNPVHCAVVMDASAWWQDSEHHKGKKSNLLIAGRRWTFLHRPQRDSNANPIVAERCKVTNARLKLADAPDGTPGRRRMFSCAHNLEINRAMAQWENHEVTKQPNRNSEHAHACDAVSYPVYRFFGAPKKKRDDGADDRGSGRFDRAEQLKGW